jgi:DNA-binding transcriptional ArsR family regulator
MTTTTSKPRRSPVSKSKKDAKQRAEYLRSQILKAMTHPLRARILAILEKVEASPSQLARELDAPLGNISYHVRILASIGLIELVKTTPKRGSVEHHYAVTGRPMISDQTWATIPQSLKRTIIGTRLEQIGKHVTNAAHEEGFFRPEVHLSETILNIDLEGWSEVSGLCIEFLNKIYEIERDAMQRIKKGETKADPAMALLMVFEHKKQLSPEEETETEAA